jgi:hypothetical protein
MKLITSLLLISATLLFSCSKNIPDTQINSNVFANTGSGPSPNNDRSILVDASKDGGVWWSPQAQSATDPNSPHQGKPLADYLRGLGYRVDELAPGTTITPSILDRYKYVIRANAFFNYSTAELDAYTSFLNRNTALLLLSDHLQNTVNDRLSHQLGLNFEGAFWGPVTSFEAHEVTNSTNSFPFVAGSVVKRWDANRIKVLGTLSNGYGTMGVVNNPNSKIFFIGDTNGIEQMPQPLTSNLIKWLFN